MITQAGVAPSISVTPNIVNIDLTTSSTATVSITSNCPWAVDVGPIDFADIRPISGQAGTTDVIGTVSPINQSGTVTINSTGVSPATSATVSVTVTGA